jgi:hypothetical protein
MVNQIFCHKCNEHMLSSSKSIGISLYPSIPKTGIYLNDYATIFYHPDCFYEIAGEEYQKVLQDKQKCKLHSCDEKLNSETKKNKDSPYCEYHECHSNLCERKRYSTNIPHCIRHRTTIPKP